MNLRCILNNAKAPVTEMSFDHEPQNGDVLFYGEGTYTIQRVYKVEANEFGMMAHRLYLILSEAPQG